MQSKATTVKAYLESLPADRRRTVEAIREVIRANLDPGFEEGMQYGGIGYSVPHGTYPAGYHCDPKQPLPFAGIISQKGHVGIYLFCIYGSPAEEAAFRSAWTKTGKKLDMGKSCVRVRKLEDVALDVLGRTIARVSMKKFIAGYEKALEGTAAGAKHAKLREKLGGGASARSAPSGKAATRKKAAKRAPARKASAAARKKTAARRSAGR